MEQFVPVLESMEQFAQAALAESIMSTVTDTGVITLEEAEVQAALIEQTILESADDFLPEELMQEGETWDKIKQWAKENKGKLIAGGLAAALAGAGYAAHKGAFGQAAQTAVDDAAASVGGAVDTAKEKAKSVVDAIKEKVGATKPAAGGQEQGSQAAKPAAGGQEQGGQATKPAAGGQEQGGQATKPAAGGQEQGGQTAKPAASGMTQADVNKALKATAEAYKEGNLSQSEYAKVIQQIAQARKQG